MHHKSAALALALALTGGGAFAQSVAVQDSAFQRFLVNTTGVGQQTIGFTGSGQPVPQFSSGTLAGDGGPGLKASGSAILRNSSGGQIPVGLTARVTPAIVASFVGRALPLLGVLATGVAIYDLAKEYGFDLTRDPSGALVVRKTDPQACLQASCAQYKVRDIYFGAPFQWWSTLAGACSEYASKNPGLTYSGDPTGCYMLRSSGGGFYAQVDQRTVGQSSNPYVPSSPSEFQTALATDTSVPLSSSTARAIAQARELIGEPIPLAQPQVTGPSTSDGEQRTEQKANGDTVTITKTYNHSYTGPTINTTTTTVTSTINQAGDVSTETTTETPKIEEQPFAMPCGIPGTPPCKVSIDDSRMPPDGGNALKTESDGIDPERTALAAKLDEIMDWSLGDWSFTFALPTGCTPLDMFLGVEVNPCLWIDEIHDLMSVVWLLAGISGLFVIFSRAFE